MQVADVDAVDADALQWTSIGENGNGQQLLSRPSLCGRAKQDDTGNSRSDVAIVNVTSMGRQEPRCVMLFAFVLLDMIVLLLLLLVLELVRYGNADLYFELVMLLSSSSN